MDYTVTISHGETSLELDYPGERSLCTALELISQRVKTVGFHRFVENEMASLMRQEAAIKDEDEDHPTQ